MPFTEHKQALGWGDPHVTLGTAESTGFLLDLARPTGLSSGMWKDPSHRCCGEDQELENSSMDHVAHLVQTAPPGFQVQPSLQLSLSQLLSLGSSVLGWQVLVQGAEGSYIGYLCWLLNHCARLGLEQASTPESGVRRVGLLLLSYCHISSVTLLARRANNPRPHPATAAKSDVVEEKSGRSLLMKKLVSPHLANKDEGLSDDGEDSDGEDETVIPPLPSPALLLSRPLSWTVIDVLDESYTGAVSAISQERRVGVSAVGHKLGRWGSLAWLAVATSCTVYLFDAATIGLLPLLRGVPGNKGRFHVSDARLAEKETPEANQEANKTTTSASNQSHLTENDFTKSNLTAGCHEDCGNGQNCACSTNGNVRLLEASNPIGGNLVLDSSSEKCLAQSVVPSPCNGDCPPAASSSPPALKPTLPCDLDQASLCSGSDDATHCNDMDLEESPRHCCLRDVLEDANIEIVMHDSRNLQDLLQHKAGFTINALYDTQATEVYLYITLHRGDCPAFVPSLSSLLQRRLHLAPQHLLFERVQRRLAGDSSAYLERPLEEKTLAGIASSAAFLCELRALQLRAALADLRQLTAIHSLSHACKDDLMRSRVEQHVVPEAVQRLGRQTVLNYREPLQRRRSQLQP